MPNRVVVDLENANLLNLGKTIELRMEKILDIHPIFWISKLMEQEEKNI